MPSTPETQAPDCLFCRIISGEIPSSTVYEDETVIAFLDITPVNPGHVLIVPKRHNMNFLEAKPETLQQMILATQRVAAAVTSAMGVGGFNLEVNTGEVAGQVIPHLHLHIIPRRSDDGLEHWPGRPYEAGEAEAVKQKIMAALKPLKAPENHGDIAA